MALYSDTGMRRAMKVQEIIVRAMSGEDHLNQGGSDNRRERSYDEAMEITLSKEWTAVCLIAAGNVLLPKGPHIKRWCA